jgi:hypothetical protein
MSESQPVPTPSQSDPVAVVGAYLAALAMPGVDLPAALSVPTYGAARDILRGLSAHPDLRPAVLDVWRVHCVNLSADEYSPARADACRALQRRPGTAARGRATYFPRRPTSRRPHPAALAAQRTGADWGWDVTDESAAGEARAYGRMSAHVAAWSGRPLPTLVPSLVRIGREREEAELRGLASPRCFRYEKQRAQRAFAKIAAGQTPVEPNIVTRQERTQRIINRAARDLDNIAAGRNPVGRNAVNPVALAVLNAMPAAVRAAALAIVRNVLAPV